MKLNAVSMVLVVLGGVVSQMAEIWIVWKQSRIMEFRSSFEIGQYFSSCLELAVHLQNIECTSIIKIFDGERSRKVLEISFLPCAAKLVSSSCSHRPQINYETS
jgi:hypothetical protein